MPHNWSHIRVTPGSQDGARLPAPLQGSRPHIRPDTLAATFTQLASTARQPWRTALQAEPFLVVAQILSFHLDDEMQRFDLAEQLGPNDAAGVIKILAQQVDNWLTRIRQQWSGPFAEVLQALDQQMALTDRAKDLAETSIPRLTRTVQKKGFARSANGDALADARAIKTGLSAAHRQLVHAIAALKPASELAFATRLKSGQIDPAIGLMIAELITAQEVDKRLNRFTHRHTDFYYGDLIGQPRRGAAAERALLHLPSGATPKLLPMGTSLMARLEDGTKLRFKTETDVPVTPAKVIATAGLTYDTDPQISLFSTLGAITGIRAAFEPAEQQPLDRSVFVAPSDPPIDVGLNICSEMFRLAEGNRYIDVALHLQRATHLPAASSPMPAAPDPDQGPDPDIALELRSDPTLIKAIGFDDLTTGVEAIMEAVHEAALVRNCTPSMDLIYEVIAGKILTVEPLRVLLGRIITLGLIENHPWPTGAYWKTLETAIIACEASLTGQHTQASCTKDADKIVEAFAQEKGQFIYSPADMFEKLLGDAFDVTLSTTEGAMAAKVTQIVPLADGTSGLTLRLFYGADMPPILPFEGADDAAPRLTLRWNEQARICPVSFLERYTLDQIGIHVKVDGLRDIAGFSDDGPVAPSQSFMPFGVRPTDGATFTIASAEMARKPVTDVKMDIRWGGLPNLPGGFTTHYANYPSDTMVPDPKVTVDYLSGDGWKPVLEKARPLIDMRSYDETLNPDWLLRGNIQGSSQPASGKITTKLPKSRAQIKAGAIRLTMTGGGDFGQSQYPLALVKSMQPRRLPLPDRPVPPAPYIPKIESLSFGYQASTIMTLASPDTARPGDRITQVTPFGTRACYPDRIRRNLGLFPPRLGLGTLYIQLAGAGALRQLGILFDIADSGHLRLVPKAVELNWHYLTDDGWIALPNTAIASDTTDSLLKSGVVTLDLPDNAATPEGEMPGGGVWLAISAPQRGFETHPTLSKVRTNGVWAVCVETETKHTEGSRNWRFEAAQPGMSAPIEANRRAPPRPAETRPHYLARVSERLRHRQRAVTPFDIERLVLEAFPDVWRVKCLPHLTRTTAMPRPGHVTIVIVRHPAEKSAGPQGLVQERLFDVGTLEKIRAFLHRHGSPKAYYEVVNPSFDRIHVRASVRFAPFLDDGAMAKKLQHNLSHALSVWTAADDLSRFGWALNVPMLRALISENKDVINVTDFSVLHFVADDAGRYTLADTAQSDGRGKMDAVIRPSRPWALPLSSANHAISFLENNQKISPSQSGIGRLRIGDMLIVGQEGHP